MADKEKAKKQVPLRLSASLYEELARWAEDEFRSVNGQIEYLLTEAVRKRRKAKSKGRLKGGRRWSFPFGFIEMRKNTKKILDKLS